MVIQEWNAQEFYTLYCNIKQQFLQYCLWDLPYNCHIKDCDESLGFVFANEFDNNNSDLLIQLQNSITICLTSIYNALNHEKVLAASTKTILANCGGCGYTFLCCG